MPEIFNLVDVPDDFVDDALDGWSSDPNPPPG